MWILHTNHRGVDKLDMLLHCIDWKMETYGFWPPWTSNSFPVSLKQAAVQAAFAVELSVFRNVDQ